MDALYIYTRSGSNIQQFLKNFPVKIRDHVLELSVADVRNMASSDVRNMARFHWPCS